MANKNDILAVLQVLKKYNLKVNSLHKINFSYFNKCLLFH